jgi:hypothetical protein
MSLTRRSELAICSQNVGPTIRVAAMVYKPPIFWPWRVQILSRINTAPISIALANDTPTQMDQTSFKKCQFLVKGTVTYCPQKQITKKKLVLIL